MGELERRIEKEAQVLPGDIIKVDAFLTHQIDTDLMREIGERFAHRFREQRPTKILTAEASGIAPAVACGMALSIPAIYARKHRPITVSQDAYTRVVPSPTKGGETELIVAREHLTPGDAVLIVDDFMASGETALALAEIVTEAKARLVGVGVVIEKAFLGARERLEARGIPMESLAIVESIEAGTIRLKNARCS
ncbi:MAG: xanthine phosphoribosyltransferase [Candidatus Bipolaricaulia bacterium]